MGSLHASRDSQPQAGRRTTDSVTVRRLRQPGSEFSQGMLIFPHGHVDKSGNIYGAEAGPKAFKRYVKNQ
jgi:hypothetical protein